MPPSLLKRGVVRENDAQHEMSDQEVLRANKELAAYFKGRRTEREARAALKIIKAFIRDRERADPRSLRPLPGVKSAPAPRHPRTVKMQAVPKRASRKRRHHTQDSPSDNRLDQEGKSAANGTLARDESG
jgi:hypothetical protein